MRSHFVRLVVIVLELVGERTRAMFPKLLSMMDAVVVDDLRNMLVSDCWCQKAHLLARNRETLFARDRAS